MKKSQLLFLTVIFLTTCLFYPASAYANGVSGKSATLDGPTAKAINNLKRDDRAVILEAYLLQYNSPLAPHARTFIEEADKNNLDWKLVASIAGVESFFGQLIPPYSYNGWGFGVYGNNVLRFASWDDGISYVSEQIRVNYLGDQDTNVYLIGHKYASDPRWAVKVTNFMNQLEAYYTNLQKPTISFSL